MYIDVRTKKHLQASKYISQGKCVLFLVIGMYFSDV